MIKNGMRPIHPGKILVEEFLKPVEPPMNANRLAKAIGVPANRVTAIIKRQRGITGDTAVRLGAFFNTSAEFWMNLQKTYELRLAEKALPEKIRRRLAGSPTKHSKKEADATCAGSLAWRVMGHCMAHRVISDGSSWPTIPSPPISYARV